jgi:hypothetical protein
LASGLSSVGGGGASAGDTVGEGFCRTGFGGGGPLAPAPAMAGGIRRMTKNCWAMLQKLLVSQ